MPEPFAAQNLISAWKGQAIPLHPQDPRISRLVDAIWRDHFADIPRVTDLVAGYDYPWKRHLGRIRLALDQQTTQITLNCLLDHPEVPEAVPIAIVAHEIVHYAQGFGSPLPRHQRCAHAHGAVDQELARRGLLCYEIALDHWITEHWLSFAPRARQERRRNRTASVLVPCASASRVLY